MGVTVPMGISAISTVQFWRANLRQLGREKEMPYAFEKCVKEGGRVRTKKVNATQYVRVCYDKNGKSHSGEVKTKEKAK